VTSDVVQSASRGKTRTVAGDGARSMRAPASANKAKASAPSAQAKQAPPGKPAGSGRADVDVRPNARASPQARSLPPAEAGASLLPVR